MAQRRRRRKNNIFFLKVLTLFLLFKSASCNVSEEQPDAADEDDDDDKAWLKSWAHLTKYSHDDYDSKANSVYNLDYNYQTSAADCCDNEIPISGGDKDIGFRSDNEHFDGDRFFNHDFEWEPEPTANRFKLGSVQNNLSFERFTIVLPKI